MNTTEKVSFLDVRHLSGDLLDVNYIVSISMNSETREFTLTRKDGSTKTLPTINAPAPKSMVGAYVDNNNDLIVVMSNADEYKVGYVGERFVFEDITPVR